MSDWRELAKCRSSDPDLFFPGQGQPTAPAKAVCRVCPVAEECLDEALEANLKFGIWGGLSERERRKVRHERRRAAHST